jgi:hypothetical protein
MHNIADIFQNDPAKGFYNLDGLSTVVLTSDIDWAPEYAIAPMLQAVQDAGMKMTTFATGASQVLQDSSSFVEVGLHPDNTRPHPEFKFSRKLTDLKNLFPDATGLRCHRNFFGNNISDLAIACGIKYDISVQLWRQPFCQGFVDYQGLVRLSYYWEDGIHANLGLPLETNQVQLDSPGLKILNVHPMLLYLNCPDDNWRKKATKHIPDLASTPASEFKDAIFKGYGFMNFYIDLLAELKRRNVATFFAAEVASTLYPKT